MGLMTRLLRMIACFYFRPIYVLFREQQQGFGVMLRSRFIAAAVIAALVFPAPVYAKRHDDWHRDHHHDRDHDGDAAAGVALGIGLIGIAAAISAKKKRKAEEQRDEYRYGYGNSYGGDYFSPAPDVSCYRGERRCFVRGQFSYQWTDRQFSYDPYRRGY